VTVLDLFFLQMADQIHINNQSIEVFDDQEQENPQNEVEEVDELNKAKWMNSKSPSRLSGPLPLKFDTGL
jgi:hypothetical protein